MYRRGKLLQKLFGLNSFLLIVTDYLNYSLPSPPEKETSFLNHFPQGSKSSRLFGTPAGSNYNKLLNAKSKNKLERKKAFQSYRNRSD